METEDRRVAVRPDVTIAILSSEGGGGVLDEDKLMFPREVSKAIQIGRQTDLVD